MSNLVDYKQLIDEKLHAKIFIGDPKLLDTNIYINRDFSSTLQQLFIVKHWKVLREKINEDELWALLKLSEHRPAKLVFDGVTGELIADKSSQELFKKYYKNSLWLDDDKRYALSIRNLIFVCVLFFLLYYIFTVLEQQTNRTNNLLNILEYSTYSQQIL